MLEQEGREHSPLTKALFHSKPLRAHPVVEPHACSHAIVELTNHRDNISWHSKTGEYCPEEDSINGVVRFGKVDKAYISIIFRLSMEMSRLTRGGTAEPVSRDQCLRRERGQGNIHFHCSADHEQDWQPYPVDPYSCHM